MDRCFGFVISALILPTALLAGAPSVSAEQVDWSGGYFGANLGLATDSSDTWSRSMHLGFDEEVGGTVLGAELEYARNSISTPVQQIDNIARLKIRAGVSLRETLFYGAVGGASARGGFGTSSGYVVGLGVEQMISPHISLGGELLHHYFYDFAGDGSDLRVNILAARINYRF